MSEVVHTVPVFGAKCQGPAGAAFAPSAAAMRTARRAAARDVLERKLTTAYRRIADLEAELALRHLPNTRRRGRKGPRKSSSTLRPEAPEFVLTPPCPDIDGEEQCDVVLAALGHPRSCPAVGTSEFDKDLDCCRWSSVVIDKASARQLTAVQQAPPLVKAMVNFEVDAAVVVEDDGAAAPVCGVVSPAAASKPEDPNIRDGSSEPGAASSSERQTSNNIRDGSPEPGAVASTERQTNMYTWQPVVSSHTSGRARSVPVCRRAAIPAEERPTAEADSSCFFDGVTGIVGVDFGVAGLLCRNRRSAHLRTAPKGKACDISNRFERLGELSGVSPDMQHRAPSPEQPPVAGDAAHPSVAPPAPHGEAVGDSHAGEPLADVALLDAAVVANRAEHGDKTASCEEFHCPWGHPMVVKAVKKRSSCRTCQRVLLPSSVCVKCKCHFTLCIGCKDEMEYS